MAGKTHPTAPYRPLQTAAVVCCAFALIFAAAPLRAATVTWTGGDNNDNWNKASNWDTGVPVANDDLVFAGTTRLTPNNNTTAGTVYSSITFDNTAGAFTLGGNSITLGGNVTNNDADTQTIAMDLILNGDRTFNAASGDLTISGVISEDASPRALIKSGSGTLTLSGANTFSGDVNINAGTLRAGALDTFGSTGKNITLDNGATLNWTSTVDPANGDQRQWIIASGGGTFDIDSGITVQMNDNNGTTGSQLQNTGGGVLTVTGGGVLLLGGDGVANFSGGGITVDNGTLRQDAFNGGITLPTTALVVNTNGTFDNSTNAATVTFGSLAGAGSVTNGSSISVGGDNTSTTYSGVMSGTGSLTKNGTGTMTLSGANTYSGATTINAGTLQMGSASALGTSAGGVTVNSGGTLDFNGQSGFTETFTLAGGTLTNTGAYIFDINGDLTVTADSTIRGSGSRWDMRDNGATLTVNSGVTLTKEDSLQIAFVGTSVDIDGDFVINDGSIDFSNLSASTGTGAFTVNSGGELELGSWSTPFTLVNDVTLNSGGRLQFDNDDGGASTFSGAITITGATTVDADVGDSGIISGIISGTGSLDKVDTGEIFLTGDNTYSGATTVSAGTLTIQHVDALGDSGSATTTAVSSGATLALNTGAGGTIDNENLTLNGAGAGGAGALDVVSTGGGRVTWSGTVALGSSSTIDLNNSADELLVTGVLSGASTSDLTVTGSGRLLLRGNNTYDGQTIVDGGWLGVENTNGLGGTTNGTVVKNGGLLSVMNGTTTNASESVTLGDNTGGTSGTLTMVSGLNNTWAGAVTVDHDSTISSQPSDASGTFTVSGNVDILNSSALTLDTNKDGATLTLSGVIGNSSGSGSLTKLNTGTLNLNGANTYSGGTTLGDTSNESTNITIAGTDTAFGTGTITIRGAAIQGSGGTRTFSNTLDFENGGGNSAYFSGSEDLVFTGNADLSGGERGMHVDSGITVTLSGVIDNGNLRKAGAGTLVLSGTNTYSGGTSVDAGILQFTAEANLGATTGTLTLNGGTLFHTTQLHIDHPLSVTASSTIQSDDGDDLFFDSSTISGTAGTTLSLVNTAGAGDQHSVQFEGTGFSFAPNIDIDAFSRLHIDNTTGTQTFSGVISGAGDVYKQAAGTTLLSGNNTYTGGTQFDAGTIQINNNSSLGTGTVTLSGGTLHHIGTLTLANALNVDANSTISSDNGDDLTFSSNSVSGSAGTTLSLVNSNLTNTRTVYFSGNGFTYAGDINLDSMSRPVFSNSSGTQTFSGAITGTGHADGVRRDGAGGTTVLTGVNTYTTDTVLANGTLQLSGGGDITATDQLRVNNGTMTVTGAGSTLTTTGTGDSIFVGVGTGTATLDILADGDVSSAGQIIVGDDSGSTGTITVDGVGSTLTTSGTGTDPDIEVGSNGTGTLNVTNSGSVTIADELIVGRGGGTGTVNINTGGDVTTTGRLQIATIGTGNNGTVTIDGSGSTLTVGGDTLLGGNGTAALNVDNSGVATLNGSASINSSGSVILDGGTVNGTGSFAVNNGGTLAGTGNVEINTVVAGGGVISPGQTAVGTLTFGSGADLTMNNTSIYRWDISNASEDLVAAIDALTLNSSWTLEIHELNNGLDGTVVTEEFDLFTFTGTLSDGGSEATTGSDLLLSSYTLDLSNLGAKASWLSDAEVRYDYTVSGSGGRVYITGIAPLPGPLIMALALFAGVLLRRPARRESRIAAA